MSVDHASGRVAPQSDPEFLHVRPGMTVIVDDGKDQRYVKPVAEIGI